ncbi:hypothetical protein DFH06DRAFT_1334855 [Mycena polygramma]|nr:hypothetical protein DFH06DRAFT_1338344 [Mycena polygramma]KAJ7640507.1 hypothetical protein DFH06DRAFT_1334855 [Mycena polygramma]
MESPPPLDSPEVDMNIDDYFDFDAASAESLNINDYFDFDAASCDSKPTTTSSSWEYREQTADKGRLSPDFDQSIVARLILHRDTPLDEYQIKLDFTGVHVASYHDATFGLPTLHDASWDSETSDSESSWSAPSSPASFLSAVSPPPSPIINCKVEAEDTGFLSDLLSDEDEINALPPSPYVAPNELSLSTFTPPADSDVRPSTPSSPIPQCLHSPRPVSPRKDVVAELEAIIQPPANSDAETYHVQKQHSEEPDSALVFDKIPVHFEDRPPSRSPSREYAGRVHRVGKANKKTRTTRVRCDFPGCTQTIGRAADVPRHQRLIHNRETLAEVFRETGKDRRWCLGCISILSRGDARRRHENTCHYFLLYIETGVRESKFPPLPEIYAESEERYRLWCSKCSETFPDSLERYNHEDTCVGPPLPVYGKTVKNNKRGSKPRKR